MGPRHLPQHAVPPIPDHRAVFERLDVDVGHPLLDGLGKQHVDQADDRRLVLRFQQVLDDRHLVHQLREIDVLAEVLGEASGSVTQVGHGLDDIANATEEQRRVSGEVAANIDAIADMAKENNQAVEQTATAAKRLEQLAGDLQDAESMKATLDLFRALGSKNTDCRQDGAALGYGPREGWLFNTGLEGIEKADAILIVGANPRVEAPLLNARLRKSWIKGGVEIGVIGEQADLTFDYAYLGAGSKTLAKLPKSAMDFLTKAERRRGAGR